MSCSIYIKSLFLENIRTFGKAELNFEKEDGTLPQWTLILGDNGIGKSTLLQCIAWMAPSSKTFEGIIEPNITSEENETLLRLVKSTVNTYEKGSLNAVFVGNREFDTKVSMKEDKWCSTALAIESLNGELKDVIVAPFDTNDEELFSKEIILYAYSAARTLGKLNINAPALQDTIPAFIAEKTELFDAENILHTANYAFHGAKEKKEREDYEKYISSIKAMLVSVLPDVEDVKDVEIVSPNLKNEYKIQGDVIITTKHGAKLPFKNASLGYRTTISWTIDLAWRLFKQYPHSPEPLKEPAIVIIDEIDLHLHPVWQREIMKNLSKHFPKVQFIATAHSPLMVQAAMASNYAVLKKGTNGVEILNEPQGIDGWRVDQILTSELFGLKSSRGVEYEKLLSKRQLLVDKPKLTKAEKAKLKRITKELSELPTGETPEEIENRKVISEAAKKIKNPKKK